MVELVFWQTVVSPHMACLASEMAARGASVTYVAGVAMSADRLGAGWTPPVMPGVRLHMGGGKMRAMALADAFPPSAVHLMQGIGRSGHMAQIISVLRRRCARWGVIMESVDDRVLWRRLKRLKYAWALRGQAMPDFALAIGWRTPDWLVDRGLPRSRVFPFTYFLEERSQPVADRISPRSSFRIGFVGQLIPRKRLDLLIDALASIDERVAYQLVVIGGGPLAAELRSLALRRLGQAKVCWLGQLPMTEARRHIASLDCLVLPSEFDGWGAVVSEALMAGVPAICSDSCGAAEAVSAAGVGGIFPRGERAALIKLICRVMDAGALSHPHRVELAAWASCFGGVAGAEYLSQILECRYDGAARPEAPWRSKPRSSQCEEPSEQTFLGAD